MRLDVLVVLYLSVFAVIVIIYFALRKKSEARSIATLNAAAEAGLLEPASLHPVIDAATCLGCGACVRACPEGKILGLVDGKARLIEPTQCIGHGACRTACPTDAITLVFGTATRGVEIPHIGPDFQTNVPGIFLAGEVGGMGLIRNAIEQGRQAIDSMRGSSGLGRPEFYDVVIVGSGPAGFSASLAAMQHKLRFVTIEQESFGGTVAHYPRGKVVMTEAATLPLIGKVQFGEVSKEKLLEFWRRAARQTGLRVNYAERVEAVVRRGSGFEVRTTRRSYPTRSVLLAIGRRGTPRTLGVAGEDQTKVVYRLVDAEQYRGQHVLVVGGGDSALEAAGAIAEEPGATVTLSHRSDAFSRAKLKNRERVETVRQSGRLRVLLQSSVKSIGRDTVEVDHAGKLLRIRNDAVVICAGGILPAQFLKSIGISLEMKYGRA